MIARKAYTIDLDRDDAQAIAFGTSPLDAARNCDQWEGDPEDADPIRAPEFDQWADQGCVPMRAMLDAGWWHSCSGCERQLCAEYDDDGDPSEYVDDGDETYCSRDCMLDHYAEIGKRHGCSFGVRLDASERWPGITVTDSSGLRLNALRIQVGGVRFTFPGGRFPVDWIRGDNTVLVATVDVGAWRQFDSPQSDGAMTGEKVTLHATT